MKMLTYLKKLWRRNRITHVTYSISPNRTVMQDAPIKPSNDTNTGQDLAALPKKRGSRSTKSASLKSSAAKTRR